MANKFRFSDFSSADRGLVDLHLKFTAGTSGAIPATLTDANGITSVVLDSTGQISVHLDDTWVEDAMVAGAIQQSTFSTSTAQSVVPAIATDVTSSSDPKVVVFLLNGAGSKANMGTGDIFELWIRLRQLENNG